MSCFIFVCTKSDFNSFTIIFVTFIIVNDGVASISFCYCIDFKILTRQICNGHINIYIISRCYTSKDFDFYIRISC